MAFGEYHAAEESMITNIHGEQVLLKTPAGYGGLFWGNVYFKDTGECISMAEYYFTDLGERNDDCIYDYWMTIDEYIGKHCKKYLPKKTSEHHHYQYGFGGNNCDGLIDFWLAEPVKKMPDMEFVIEGVTYVLKWRYSSGGE